MTWNLQKIPCKQMIRRMWMWRAWNVVMTLLRQAECSWIHAVVRYAARSWCCRRKYQQSRGRVVCRSSRNSVSRTTTSALLFISVVPVMQVSPRRDVGFILIKLYRLLTNKLYASIMTCHVKCVVYLLKSSMTLIISFNLMPALIP